MGPLDRAGLYLRILNKNKKMDNVQKRSYFTLG
jgi:hypothetical protein